MKLINEFYSKIVGSTFCNGQEVIKTLSENDLLDLVPEPDNAYDKNAIMVFKKGGDRAGYIPKATAVTVKEYFDKGFTIIASVSTITGKGLPNAGCNIKIKVYGD